MPQEARIFIVEDNQYYATTLIEFLEEAGHVVVYCFSHLNGVLKILEQNLEDLRDIDVFLLDAELNGDCTAGEQIAQIVKNKFPNAAVISISSQKQQEWSNKPNITAMDGSKKIAQIITSL